LRGWWSKKKRTRDEAPGKAGRRLFAGPRTKESQPMLDVFMLIIGIGFFALAVAYAFACERL
jgi:hypothetical protein